MTLWCFSMYPRGAGSATQHPGRPVHHLARRVPQVQDRRERAGNHDPEPDQRDICHGHHRPGGSGATGGVCRHGKTRSEQHKTALPSPIYIPSHSLTHSLSHTHTHTHTHSLSLSLSYLPYTLRQSRGSLTSRRWSCSPCSQRS